MKKSQITVNYRAQGVVSKFNLSPELFSYVENIHGDQALSYLREIAAKAKNDKVSSVPRTVANTVLRAIINPSLLQDESEEVIELKSKQHNVSFTIYKTLLDAYRAKYPDGDNGLIERFFIYLSRTH